MVNIAKLKAKIIEKGLNVEKVSKLCDIDKSGFYRRINKGGGCFTVDEVAKIASVLNLTLEEVNSIFFAQFVA